MQSDCLEQIINVLLETIHMLKTSLRNNGLLMLRATTFSKKGVQLNRSVRVNFSEESYYYFEYYLQTHIFH